MRRLLTLTLVFCLTLALFSCIEGKDGLDGIDRGDSKVQTENENKNGSSDSIAQSNSNADSENESGTTPQANVEELYSFLKNWVIENGTLNGDYVYYSKSADTYGGDSDEDFSLYYWADTEQIEFCLHSVLDDTYSINFYIYIPESHTGNYEYITSFYYRDTGYSVCESKGIIEAESFSKKHPLNSKKYSGPSDLQNTFMELSREGICDTIDCLKQFLQKEKMGYTLADLGFEKF